ncbi:hypothetical protein H311_04048, partial [Anncaliia algerae PRA109]
LFLIVNVSLKDNLRLNNLNFILYMITDITRFILLLFSLSYRTSNLLIIFSENNTQSYHIYKIYLILVSLILLTMNLLGISNEILAEKLNNLVILTLVSVPVIYITTQYTSFIFIYLYIFLLIFTFINYYDGSERSLDEIYKNDIKEHISFSICQAIFICVYYSILYQTINQRDWIYYEPKKTI